MAVGLVKLDTATLLWAATVVRHGCHIGNRCNTYTQCTQRSDRRFTARTWAFDFDVKILDALFNGCTTSDLRSYLGCKRCRLARTFEPLATRGSPRQSIALAIGDRDDGVVERCMHVCNTVSNVFTDFFANALCGVIRGGFCHSGLSIPFISSKRQHLCADPCGYVHWYEYADHAWAGHDDGESHGSNQCPSNV